ncbi:FAD dependent oxidoreductase family protein [Coniochaeta sp. PMI_546]|nr:FAD dependent oxidoreductase family protein [Coniochaeta sp. PMI_546]
MQYHLVVCVAALIGHVAATCPPAAIERQVVIIGGGCAGVYAATQLRSLGVSFAVVEKRDHFGGHTATYTIPGTNITIDYGVQGYSSDANGNYDIIEQFFQAYNVPIEFWKGSETGFGVTRYFDFRNATEVAGFTFDRDLSKYSALVSQYPYLEYETATPRPIPRDFLLPFGDFVKKYSLQSSVFNIFYNAEGLGDLLSQPTFYVLRELGPGYLRSLSPDSNGSIITADHFNQEPYLRAEAQFGNDSLVSSTVVAADRGLDGVCLRVQTPTGSIAIKAKKLLVTMPPTLRNMEPLDLSGHERQLFAQFKPNGWYAGLINVTGLPANNSFQNVGIGIKYNLPVLPAMYQLSPLFVPNVYLFRYGSQGYKPEADIQSDIIATVQRIRKAVVPNADALSPPRILAFANHFPFNLHVPASDLSAGFYDDLDALQGVRSTWYSGAAFFGHSATKIWNVTEVLVKKMVAA